MYKFFVVMYGLVAAFFAYSLVIQKQKVPSKASMVLVRRIKDSNLSEAELEEKYRSLHEKLLQPIAKALVGAMRVNRLTKMELSDKLAMANVNKTPEEFFIKQATTGLGFFIISFLWIFILRTPLVLIPGLALAGYGMMMPLKELDKRIEERKNRIIMELPDFLDMLVLSLRAGRNLYSAIKKASEQSGPALRPLLEKLQADLELVEDKKDALWRFAESTGIQEVKDFVSAIEIGMDAKVKQAEEIYRSQSRMMRSLREMALKKYTRSIPSKVKILHVILFLNCILIPIVSSLLQFASVMKGM